MVKLIPSIYVKFKSYIILFEKMFQIAVYKISANFQASDAKGRNVNIVST